MTAAEKSKAKKKGKRGKKNGDKGKEEKKQSAGQLVCVCVSIFCDVRVCPADAVELSSGSESESD